MRILRLLPIAALIVLGWSVPANGDERSLAADFVTKINALRVERGVPTLSVQPVMVKKAEAWAETMAAAGHPSHSQLHDGVDVPWELLGENVAVGPVDVAAIHRAFMASPTHLANLVDARFQGVGIGVAVRGNLMFVAEEFMQPLVRQATTTTSSRPTAASASSTTTAANGCGSG